MKRLQSFKYELIPSGKQKRKLICFSGACRFVYNKALSIHKIDYENGNKFTRSYEMCKLLPVWKKEFVWLGDCSAQSLQSVLANLDRAFINFFEKRSEYPRFKKRGRGDSIRFPQQFKLDQKNNRIYLAKLGWMQYRNSREVSGTVKNITVTLSNGKWYASIQTQREVEVPVAYGSAVGIDVGVVRFATLSDGTVYKPLNIFKKTAAQLKSAQKRMSHKKKFSNNWKKAKARVQRIHARIANARRDYLHKTSTTISKNHAMVIVEDLKVSNMSRSAAGTVEQPGKNVRAKSGLNKSILDQGWSGFRRQLEYKMLWSGGIFVAVPPQNTSRTCPSCEHVSKHNRKTQAEFVCVECGYAENADLVGAINILRAGHARIACEVNGAVMPSAAGTRLGELCAA